MGNRNFEESVRQARERRPSHHSFVNGTTGKLDANGVLIADAAADLEAPYSYVRLNNNRRGGTRVVNTLIDRHAAGIDVETAISYRTGQREVVGVLPSNYLRYSESTMTRILLPTGGGAVHESDILAGKVEPDSDLGGLWIRVRAVQTPDGTFPASIDNATYELTEASSVSTDRTAPAYVYADPADDALHVIVGAELGLAYPYTQADFDTLVLPYGVYPLAGLVLMDGQTDASDSFVKDVRYFDRRSFVRANGVTNPGWLVRTDTTVPTGVTMVQAGTVRVAEAALTLNGTLTLI